MKIAIAGGAGFIGSHLVQAYLDAGHDVIVIDNLIYGSRAAVDPRARFYRIDIRDVKLHTILQLERPDMLSHHVSYRESALPAEESLADADVQVRGLLNVLEGCVSASVGKIIYASGGNGLYGCVANREQPVSEDNALSPQQPRDIHKVTGEWYVKYYTQRYHLPHTILRYSDIYGEPNAELAQHPLSYFVHMLLEGRRPTIRGTAEDVRDHLFIDDVVRANLGVLERGINQTLHISSGHGHTLKQFYQAIAHVLGTSIEPLYISNSLSEQSSIILDNSLAYHVLGWRPEVDFAEGIWRAVNLIRASKREPISVFDYKAEPVLAAAIV
jgi:UDP-glucose 4-epimerase